MAMASKAEQRYKEREDANRGKPLFPVVNIETARKGARDEAHTVCIANGKALGAGSTDDISATHAMIIKHIRDYAGKRGIVITIDAIHGKTGVGEPGSKKRPGYGSAGAPGLLQKAMACVEMETLSYMSGDRETAKRVPTGNYDSVVIGHHSDNSPIVRHIRRMETVMVESRKEPGKLIKRAKWKVIVEWEIRLMAERSKERPLLRKMVRDKETGIKSPSTKDGGYVGLVPIAHGNVITPQQAKVIDEYVAQIRCTLFVDHVGLHYVKIPPQWERSAVVKRLKQIMSDD